MINTCGPRAHSSPILLGPNDSPVSVSTTFPSVLGGKTPHEPGIKSLNGVVVKQGASLIPKPGNKDLYVRSDVHYTSPRNG